jgi:hypothetical protein
MSSLWWSQSRNAMWLRLRLRPWLWCSTFNRCLKLAGLKARSRRWSRSCRRDFFPLTRNKIKIWILGEQRYRLPIETDRTGHADPQLQPADQWKVDFRTRVRTCAWWTIVPVRTTRCGWPYRTCRPPHPADQWCRGSLAGPSYSPGPRPFRTTTPPSPTTEYSSG